MSLYEERFEMVHEVLKDYGCYPTFTFHPAYVNTPILGGSYFYQPMDQMHIDHAYPKWHETVDASLDVCVPTKSKQTKKGKIRFDIEWSQKAKLYSMYVSLPTSSRSISLSRTRHKTQGELIGEVLKWIKYTGCKKIKAVETQKVEAKQNHSGEQLRLF